MASQRDALQQVVAIRSRYESTTAELQTRVWNAWREDLAQMQRAAEALRGGAGRLGQLSGRHRRAVREAGAELAAFATRWHPAIPELATDPAELAGQVSWLHGRRLDDPINAFIARAVADAHPNAHQIRATERDAHSAYEEAERSRAHLDQEIHAELRRYGAAAHTRDPGRRLDAVVDELTTVEHELRAATARVDALQRHPAVRDVPAEGLDGERDRWAAHREERRQAAANEATERRQRQQQTRRIEPPPAAPSTLNHGPGIGR